MGLHKEGARTPARVEFTGRVVRCSTINLSFQGVQAAAALYGAIVADFFKLPYNFFVTA
jgi:hypothetical protein